MQSAYSLLLLTAAYPLWIAWRANRHTALEHAVLWTVAAWLGWLLVFVPGGGGTLEQYVALSLTGCAGVAVLGARRPHVGAWNFVVVSLFAVLLLPVAQGWGRPALNPPYLTFLGATVGFGLLNYLPTRLLPAVLLFGAGATAVFVQLCGVELNEIVLICARCSLALSPWLALVCGMRSYGEVSAVDREWLSFRDRFGVVWGQRSREQFNRAATNAGWPIVLSWYGLEIAPDKPLPPMDEMLTLLRSVLQRFGTA